MPIICLTPTLTLVKGLLPMNVYLVREDDGYTLVDTGLPGSGSHWIAAAAELGGSIRRVTLTHSHLDHIGSLDDIVARLPEAEFSLGAREAEILGGDRSTRAGEPLAPLKGTFLSCKARPHRCLRSGDRVGSLEVVDTPGHTPGHISFFDSRDGSLIAGDSWQTVGGLAVSGQLRWRFPFPAWATWHPATALMSAKAMLELKPRRLAVGHGPCMENPLQAMEVALSGG